MAGDLPFLLGPGQGRVSIRRCWVSSRGGWFHTRTPSQMPREGSHALGTSSASSRILSQVRPFILSSRVDLTIYGCVTSLDRAPCRPHSAVTLSLMTADLPR